MRILRGLCFVAVLFLLLGWLFLGVFRDPEFDDLYLFVKHRPSPHFYFYLPYGDSDVQFDSLTARERRAWLLFREFVESERGWRRSLLLKW
jgi:hypothetical protein